MKMMLPTALTKKTVSEGPCYAKQVFQMTVQALSPAGIQALHPSGLPMSPSLHLSSLRRNKLTYAKCIQHASLCLSIPNPFTAPKDGIAGVRKLVSGLICSGSHSKTYSAIILLRE